MSQQEDWQLVADLFNDALDLEPHERRDYLDRSCEDDDQLKEVLDLLADENDGEGDGLLQQPYFSLRKTQPSEDAAVGRRIGSYRLVRQLGRGGMGAVYLAERVDEFEQQVAIKLLHPGLSSRDVLDRFRGERQILAKLTHPNIARLLDGGTTDEGLPFFVMEHVDGQPIDRYCDEHKLSVRQRLGLFRSVCAAVSFAHQNLVVHRDLKPGNILVTSEGRVKLLDFGIAKLLEGEHVLTAQGDVGPMTPPYASPEQVRGESVNTTSDVYSLGVILYELLTGRRPHEATSPGSLALAICEDEPRRPSTVELGERIRVEEPTRLRRRLAGDLDNIVMKAIRKEPERRFLSVEQLSEDVRRHLEDLPVRSRPDTWTYRTRKFVGRHRWGVAAAVLVSVLVISFTTSTVIQNARITRQYEEILHERDRVRSATDFLVDVLGTTDPRQAKGETPDVREVLDTTANRLQTELADEPLIRATLLDAIGRVYHSLGLPKEARPPLQEALELRRKELGANDPVLAESLHNLAGLERTDKNIESAERLMREAISIQRLSLPGLHRDLAMGLSNLASLLQRLGQLDEAEGLAREALSILERSLEVDPTHSKAPRNELAIVLNNLSRIATDQGDLKEAEALYLRSADVRRNVEGPDDPGLARTLNNLAMLWVDHLDRPREAIPLYQESLRIRLKVYGEGHPYLWQTFNNLALAFLSVGDNEEAQQCFDEAFSIFEGQPSPLLLRKNEGLLLAALGDFDACEELTDEILPLMDESNPARIAETKSLRGECLAGLGRLHEAAPLLRQGYDDLLRILGRDERRTCQAFERLERFESNEKPSSH